MLPRSDVQTDWMSLWPPLAWFHADVPQTHFKDLLVSSKMKTWVIQKNRWSKLIWGFMVFQADQAIGMRLIRLNVHAFKKVSPRDRKKKLEWVCVWCRADLCGWIMQKQLICDAHSFIHYCSSKDLVISIMKMCQTFPYSGLKFSLCSHGSETAKHKIWPAFWTY